MLGKAFSAALLLALEAAAAFPGSVASHRPQRSGLQEHRDSCSFALFFSTPPSPRPHAPASGHYVRSFDAPLLACLPLRNRPLAASRIRSLATRRVRPLPPTRDPNQAPNSFRRRLCHFRSCTCLSARVAVVFLLRDPHLSLKDARASLLRRSRQPLADPATNIRPTGLRRVRSRCNTPETQNINIDPAGPQPSILPRTRPGLLLEVCPTERRVGTKVSVPVVCALGRASLPPPPSRPRIVRMM